MIEFIKLTLNEPEFQKLGFFTKLQYLPRAWKVYKVFLKMEKEMV